MRCVVVAAFCVEVAQPGVGAVCACVCACEERLKMPSRQVGERAGGLVQAGKHRYGETPIRQTNYMNYKRPGVYGNFWKPTCGAFWQFLSEKERSFPYKSPREVEKCVWTLITYKVFGLFHSFPFVLLNCFGRASTCFATDWPLRRNFGVRESQRGILCSTPPRLP